ncbi:MAG: M1 family metallopeptidase [Methylobacter sp.]|nr:M1 family metallopeptidase [Methylobacter sp.]
MYRLLISATALALGGLSAQPVQAVPATSSIEQTTTQLPRGSRPSHYDVVIKPNAKSLTFDGKASIFIEVLQPVNSITLNAAELVFAKAVLSKDQNGASFPASSIQLNQARQTATFTFEQTIAPGWYWLGIDYTGKIGTQAAGLFALDYDSNDGRKRALYTQFETSDARRVIPSWDEPSYKATFKLEATIPTGQLAVSNMPVEDQRDLGKGYSRVRFLTSPKMSTYLLFFGLGDFDRATAKLGDIEIGVITKKGGTAQAAFALTSTQRILQEYNDYFGTPYPLPKLDNVAAPGRSQFFSAMENWGAIFTFEHSILLDPSISTQADKQRAFMIAAHETAHQWFGNLVTMAWWDDLWLNESFASWMESRTTARLHPEWNSALSDVGDRDRAIELDSLSSTHPVVQHVETVAQVNQAFDAITYQKGEAVIRMLEAYVRADAWRSGIRQYMQAHRYGNTVSADLWRELEAVAGKPIAAIARDFTLQPGVPLIRVEDLICTAGTSQLRLFQDEFSKNNPDKKPLRWRVPVRVQASAGGAPVSQLVTAGKSAITVPGCGPVIVNAGQSGYFRTLYAPKHFAEIVNSFASIAAIDQLGILSDTSSLGLAGLQSAADVLELVKATPLSADPQVWNKIASVFRSIDEFYRGDTAHQAQFRTFAIAHLTPVFAKTGWTAGPDEPDTVAILRNDLIGTLGSLGAPDIIAEARRRYGAQNTDPTAVPAPLRKTILSVVAQHADTATWEQLHTTALAEKTPLIKDQLYALLSATEDENLARRALDLALTAEPGATTSSAMIQAVSKFHPDLAFDFAVAHLPAVTEKLDAPSRGNYLARLAERSLDPAMIGKINAYAAANLAPGSRRSADTAIAAIGYRISVRNKRLPLINQWLGQYGK